MSATPDNGIAVLDGKIDHFMQEWKRKLSANGNWFFAGEFGIEALCDRVVIIEDEFRSGYECETCHESGSIVCPACSGSGKSSVVEHALCTACRGAGQIKCAECNGKGHLIIIPDAAKRRPTTGQIVSLGYEVSKAGHLKMGDFVIYPNFCGEVYDLSGINSDGKELTIVVRVIKEREIISRTTGHLKLRRMKAHTSQVTG